MPENKPTILMMSDCPLLHTGQAVVVREIAMGLHNTGKYNVVVAAWGYNGYPHPYPFTMIPASAPDFGRNGFPQAGIPGIDKIIDMIKPQVFWTIGDIWMVNYIAELKNRSSFKWVAYTPVDGDPIPDYWNKWLQSPDKLVLETKYGEDEVKKVDDTINSTFIFHGCKPDIYYPLPDEAKKNIRKQVGYLAIEDANRLTPRQGLPDDAFVVGTIARNQPRKNFDKNLKAFKIFAEDKPNARLWLHASPVDQGYNLPLVAKQLGIMDKVIFTPNYHITHGLSEQDMNVLMNIFDVHFLPTQGEGFGIPILETMAAGVPQVVTDYTSHVEYSKTAAELVKVDEYDDFITGIPHPVERAIPKPTRCAAAMQKIYEDAKHRETLGNNARNVAEKMSWAATIPQWDEVMEEMLTGPAKQVATAAPQGDSRGIKIMKV